MDNFITREESDLKNIFSRFKKRDFSGNTGLAIRNSGFQLATNIIMKFGSLFFTIIVARLLMPELFGLYSLALATILFFSAFSDFGLATTLLTFVANSLGKNEPEKAKAYFRKLLKWKFVLIIICSIVLLSSAYFVAKYYYNKPIFYALLVGGLYLPAVGFIGFIEQIFRANNIFKTPMVKEIIFQVLRLTLIPLGILLLLKTNLSNQLIVSGIILILAFCYLVSLLFLILIARKKLKFLKSESKELSSSQIKDMKKFLFPLIATFLSGVFFGYIDTLMLGHFVSGEFIAYYGAAFSLVGSAVAIIGFVATAIFPIFSKLEGKSLEKLFRKSMAVVFVISLLSAIFTYFFAYYIVKIAYGADYLNSIQILRAFSILVFIMPLSLIYDTYLTTQKKTKIIAKLLVISTILNIILNYFAIAYGLKFGMMQAVLGATFATILSRVFYFAGIAIAKKNYNY